MLRSCWFDYEIKSNKNPTSCLGMSDPGCAPQRNPSNSAVRSGHGVWSGRLAAGWWCEDIWVADAQLQIEEARGRGDAAVLDVCLLNRVAVAQGVHAHPRLI